MREIIFNARRCDDKGGNFPASPSFESLLSAGTLDELAVLASRATRSLGFEHFLYAAWLDAPRSRGKGAEPLQFVFSGYPEAWVETYRKRDYLSIDPVVEHCRSKATPLVWRTRIFDTPARRELWEEARGAGLANSCGAAAAVRQCDEAAEKAYLFSAYLHEALQNRVFQPEGYALRGRPSFTLREQELGRWTGCGSDRGYAESQRTDGAFSSGKRQGQAGRLRQGASHRPRHAMGVGSVLKV